MTTDSTTTSHPESIEAQAALMELPEDEKAAFEVLLDDGPQAVADMEEYTTFTAEQRLYGMTRLKPRARTNTTNENRSRYPDGGAKPVYYLYFDHDPRDVIETFCDANPRFVETTTLQAGAMIFGGYGSEWADAANDVLTERGAKNPHYYEPPEVDDADV